MKRKNKPILILIIIISLLLVKIIQNKSVYAGDTEIYDVILFWGQSNMVGCMQDLDEERFDNQSEEEVENFSKATGIDTDILYNTTKRNYTKIEQKPSTVYEYKYLTNSLEEINSNTKTLGEGILYNTSTGKFSVEGDFGVAAQSYGINMIPEFCRTYYERTGHKVIAVMCAAGGQRIQTFLPVNDEDHIVGGENNVSYIYEGIVEKYNAAISYCQNNGYTIGNKLWVSCQGESNVMDPAAGIENYKSLFLKVHNNLKNDLGITKGAIVQTSMTIGDEGNGYYQYTETIHQAQEALIAENDDIILGSAYSYERYIPDQTTYENPGYINKIFTDEQGNKLSYSEAFKNASYSVDYPGNTIHFTSATLSQMGREAATSFTNAEEISIISNPTKTSYIQNYEKLNLDGGKLRVKLYNGTVEEIDMTDPIVEVSGFDNTKTGTNTVSLTVRGKTIGLDVNIVPKSLVSIGIKNKPTKTEYIQNYEELDLTGGSIIRYYDDQSSNDLLMTDENVKVTGFDNKTIGEKTLTVEYKGQITTFKVNIVEKSLIGIEIKEQPSKSLYKQNHDELNLTGGVITLKYNDETIDELSMTDENVKVIGFDKSIKGEQILTVEYKGQTTTFRVNILDEETYEKYEQMFDVLNKYLEEIVKNGLPTKTEYIQNYEELDLRGGTLLLKYKDGTTEEILMTDEDVIVTGFDNTNIGEQTLTVEYKGATTTFNVNIVEKSLIGIEVSKEPDKTEYIQNYEELDLKGGEITLIYNDETREKLSMENSAVEVTDFDNTQIGERELTVVYKNQQVNFKIKIVEKSLVNIDIKELPNKLQYIKEYEQLDLNGGTILALYNNETTEEIKMVEENVDVTGFDNSTIGKIQLTVTYKGKSDTFTVDIVEKSIIGVKVKNQPKKIEYIQNYETLDLSEGTILVQYDNETIEEVSMDNQNVEVTGFDNSKVGKQTITLNYGGKTTTFEIEVKDKSILEIQIKSKPSKLEYIQNFDKLNLTGGIIFVKYDNGTTEEVKMNDSNIEVVGFDNSKIGKQTITVKYENLVETFEIEIINKSILEISIKKLPNKLTYIMNKEKLDLTGGTILVKYNDNTEEIIKLEDERIKVTGFDNSKKGKKIIQIAFNEKITNFDIEVVEKETIKDNSENIDNTVTKNEIPNAGRKNIRYIVICVGICFAIFCKRKSDKIQIK